MNFCCGYRGVAALDGDALTITRDTAGKAAFRNLLTMQAETSER